MTSKIKTHGWTIVALATLCAGGIVQAAFAAETGNAETPMEWHHSGSGLYGHGPEGGLFQALRQLNLSEAQKEQVRSITSNARARWQSRAGSDANDSVAFDNPGDPNHGSAVAAAKVRAAKRIQDWSDMQQQVYDVLTADQRTQLPQVLTDTQTRHGEKHGAQSPPAQDATGS